MQRAIRKLSQSPCLVQTVEIYQYAARRKNLIQCPLRVKSRYPKKSVKSNRTIYANSEFSFSREFNNLMKNVCNRKPQFWPVIGGDQLVSGSAQLEN